MKKILIMFFIFLLLSSTVFLIQKSVYDNKIRLVNSELLKLKEENKFINELNDKLLNNSNPIDKKEKECLDNAQSTADSLNCCDIAIQEWENEIEKYMVFFKQTMTDDEYSYIQRNQNSWKKQNESTTEIISKYVFNHGGTMYYQVASGIYAQEIKQRAEFLKLIYEIYNNEI